MCGCRAGGFADAWLEPVPEAETPEALRERYFAFLRARRDGGRGWLPEVAAGADR